MVEKTAAFRQRRAADMRACRKRQAAGIALFYVAADETTYDMMQISALKAESAEDVCNLRCELKQAQGRLTQAVAH